ncbi:MAG: hypothetical protein J5506_07165 [Prevotella sp.]|nr:hypothetical protein [Prevotella sp.]
MISATNFNELKGTVDYFRTVPYDVTRQRLYAAADLYEGFNPDDPQSFSTCHDTLVYQHYMQLGKQARKVEEALARTLHDHGIHMALDRFFDKHDGRLCIGIMGGHALQRTDAMFRQIVMLSKRLTEEGFFMLSGGGPGAMEATHLGAWMAGRSTEDTLDAISMLASAPTFRDEGWLATAFRVMRKYPQQQHVSLGVPTWLYGHEPSTPFATHIAKFFENSIREDSILTLAFGGIIYTPGSAGTMQEIFQDAVQNHYLSFGFSSPMVFLGKDFWTKEMPVYPLLVSLMEAGKYKNLLLTLTDQNEEILAELKKFREKSEKY